MEWFRFYSDALRKRKVQALPATLFRAWINLLCLANDGEPRGTLPTDISDIAFALRVKPDKAREILETLIERNLFDRKDDRICAHNWEKRQPGSDNVAARVRKHREQKPSSDDSGNVTETFHETPAKRYGNVLDPDTDPDTDPDRSTTTTATRAREAEEAEPRRFAFEGDDRELDDMEMATREDAIRAIQEHLGQFNSTIIFRILGFTDLGAQPSLIMWAIREAEMAGVLRASYVLSVLKNAVREGNLTARQAAAAKERFKTQREARATARQDGRRNGPPPPESLGDDESTGRLFRTWGESLTTPEELERLLGEENADGTTGPTQGRTDRSSDPG